MKRIGIAALSVVILVAIALPAAAQQYVISKTITDWLTGKSYEGAKRAYTEADLAVPDRVMKALGDLGVSHLTIIRNEMYARHGYIFKTPVLLAIYAKIPWYRQDPAVGLNALTSMEVRNVNWIKKIEDEYDYTVVSAFMNARAYTPDRLYATSAPYGEATLEVPLNVQLALNHLYINPARLFRNEIFARHGLAFSEALLKKIFSGTKWYKPVSADESRASKDMTNREQINLALLREREWVEIMDSVKFSLPTGVTSIPVLGFNALFIKDVEVAGETFRYSWPDAWTAMEEKGKGLDRHVTDVETLVDAKTIESIKAEADPRKKIILYFTNKKYAGYVDKIQMNHSDMATPGYLADAVNALGLDWYLLLRKEIHARNGARFIDPNVGPIFRACPWYKAKYDLNPRTLSRFPSGVTINSQELQNYSLLEGEELFRRVQDMRNVTDAKIACDLQGNFYFVKLGEANIAGDESLELGHGFTSLQEYEAADLQTLIDTLIESYHFDLEEYRQEEAVYIGEGC
jgi:hypothetical protein